MKFDIPKIVDAIHSNNAEYITEVQQNATKEEMHEIMQGIKRECKRRLKENKLASARKLGYID